MTLSRTARILIALLLVAAAAFVWINFFSTSPDATPASPTVQTPAQPSATDGAAGDAAGDAADGATADGAAAADAAAGDAAAGDAAADGGAAPTVPVSPDGATPTVVTTPDDAVVGRDVEVAEFPFLIDQPPAEEADAEEGAEDGAAAAGGAAGDARASINPFSPIVLPEQATVAEARPESTPSPEVQTVDVPDAPDVETVQAEVPVPAAPAPRALAPAGSVGSQLPRALAGGTLPVAPDILTSTRAEPATLTPIDLPERTAIREPDGPVASGALPALAGADGEPTGDPAPLAPGQVPAAGTPDEPLIAGADGLARFLRDRNVAFTGSVVGSVGVGVFRVDGTASPIVLALGQSIPDTEIVLTDLRGQTAEFTLDDTTHVLTLDLRR